VGNEFYVLQDRLRRFAEAGGWEGFHSPRNLALALAGEVGELVAELQWVADDQVADRLQDPSARERLADEIADVLIYLVRFAGRVWYRAVVGGLREDRAQRSPLPAHPARGAGRT
jgi:NTP pyrophosphatase (non-canonical NTP hydrolase)